MALGVVAVYIALMVMLSRHTRDRARAQLAVRGITPDTIVVDPQFATPVTRGVTYLWQGSYHLATYRVFGGGLSESWAEVAVHGDHPAIDLANATPAGREYHSWARLPYYVVEDSRDTTWVFIGDARYTLNAHGSWAAVRIPVVRKADRVPGQ